MSSSQKVLLCFVGATFEWKQASQSREIDKEKLAEQMVAQSMNRNESFAEYEAIFKLQKREYAHVFFAENRGNFFPAGKIDKLKQTVKSSEDQITDFGAQLHRLKMHSQEKDTHIKEYEAQVKHHEGKCK